MAQVVIMPRQGQSVESCVITAFNKKVGDTVEKGEILFSYETDKSSFDEPAPEAGKILAIFREEGDDVPCLENVLVIGNDGEDFSAFVPANAEAEAPADEKPTEAPAVVEAAPAATTEAAPSATEGVGSISPRARLLAEKTHADLLKAVPTGPNGRIIERDVQKLVDMGLTVSPAAKDGYTQAIAGSGINGKVVLGDLNAPAAAPEAAAAPAPVAAAPVLGPEPTPAQVAAIAAGIYDAAASSITPEVIAAIAAAVKVTVGSEAKILDIKPVDTSYGQSGRTSIMNSHTINRG